VSNDKPPNDPSSTPEQYPQGFPTGESRGPLPSEARHADSEYLGRGRQERRSVILTALIFVVTCVYSIFSGGQWNDMNKALVETKINRELEYRAYVGTKAAILVPHTDNPAWADVVVVSTNTGRTPALEVRLRPGLQMRQNPLPEDTALNEPDVQGGESVYLSSVDMSTIVGIVGTNIADTLMNTRAPAPGKGGKVPKQLPPVAQAPVPSLTPPSMQTSWAGWYAYGMITYRDIFGKDHWTKFCYFNTPHTASWVTCPTFNGTDTQQGGGS